MGWLKLDDQRLLHPKLMGVSPYAELLDVRGLLYCARHESDGRIPRHALSLIGVRIPAAKKRAEELVGVGRWHGPDHDCGDCPPVADGWYVHDYLEYNPSKEKREAEREIARRRSAMNANPELAKYIKVRDADHCRYCRAPVNWRDRKGPTGGTYDHVIPVSHGGDEHPDNLVTACRRCNLTKGPRTPEEAGMTLLPPPSRSQPKSGRDQAGIQTGSSSDPDIPVPVPRSSSTNNGARAKRDADKPNPHPPPMDVPCERPGWACEGGEHTKRWPCYYADDTAEARRHA